MEEVQALGSRVGVSGKVWGFRFQKGVTIHRGEGSGSRFEGDVCFRVGLGFRV